MKRILHADCDNLHTLLDQATQDNSKTYQVILYANEQIQDDLSSISDKNWVSLNLVYIRRIIRNGLEIR